MLHCDAVSIAVQNYFVYQYKQQWFSGRRPVEICRQIEENQMATRLAPAPGFSGVWGEGLRQTGLKVIAYVTLLAEAFAEAKAEARAAQARYGFISE